MIHYRRAPLALAVLVTALAVVLLFADKLAGSARAAAGLTILIAVTGIVTLMRLVPGRPLTLGVMYLLIFTLFHAGLLPYVMAGSTPDPLAEAAWFHSPVLAAAITSVAVGVLAFLAGYAAVLSTRQVPVPADPPDPGREETPASHGVGLLGFILAAAGILLWFGVTVANTGTQFVTQSYDDFLARTADAPLPFAYLFIGLGLGALGLSPDPRLRRWGLIAFTTFALPAFLIGLRGEVIFPLAAWLVATARRRNIRFRAGSLVLLLGALTAGSVVRQVRQLGFSTDALKQVVVNPLDGLVELGSSLQPLVEVHLWHSYEPFIGWGTYWAPVERLLLGRVLGLTVPETGADHRVFTTTIFDRVGPIGGSPAAESYRSAGLLGVVVVLALIGLLAGWLDSQPATSPVASALGMIGYVLLVWVRNDFTPVVFDSLACLAVVCLGTLLDAVLKARRRQQLSPRVGLPVPSR